MKRRVIVGAIVGVAVLGFVIGAEGLYRTLAKGGRSPGAVIASAPGKPGPSLYQATNSEQSARPSASKVEPIVIADCRLAVIDKQEVPSQRDGVLLYIGTDAITGHEPLLLLPLGLGPVLINSEAAIGAESSRIVSVQHGPDRKLIRRWKEGDRVLPGQLLAQLDDRLARDDYLIKKARVAASQADLVAAEKTRDEARNRYETQLKLHGAGAGATSTEELRGAKLTWDRNHYEAIGKREALVLAERELNQAQTVLAMHQLRSAIPGVIKVFHKQAGEAVRNLEPVVQVHGLARLRVEGLADVHYLSRLQQGMRVVIEPSYSESPQQILVGHLQEITSVAVGKNAIVSASEDHTVRVWERSTGRERRILPHPGPVRAVACTPPGVAANLCLSGAADGKARLWDLDNAAEEPVFVLDGHRSAVTCAAFSPDGKWCATGGDDREVILWETSTGKLRYRFPAGHRGTLTSLQFTPHSQLVSAGRDNTLRLWTVGDREAILATTFDKRSGEVTTLGVSPDGRRVLFDQGPALRLLSLPHGLTDGVLPAAGAAHFTTFALFSADGRLVATRGASDERVQVWRIPTATTRGYPLRHLVAAPGADATCGAFSPDGSFLVTGTRDRQVLVWPLPAKEEIERQITAEVTLIEQALESSTRQVRVWAELPNPGGRLLPGGTVTMAIYPAGNRNR